MWFGLSHGQEAEVPNKLISAHAEGRLVLFVGAGASVDAPSGLPTFQKLTKRLCAESQEPPPEDGTALDKALGDLKNKEVDVHQRVKAIISSPESKPNDLHNAIAELASVGEPRIVTTNYDRHLYTSLEERLDGDLDEYLSLAFPQREGFTGIVYLHGSVKEPAEHLVVTDADFSRAYLEAPWTAAQFLSRVFRSSTVLFIGYSHDDTLMEYLARSLPADETDRFALCSQEEAEKGLWQRRGIEPISYGAHQALPKLLAKWAERARMGILEHRQRVKTILQGVPPLSREDESYLQETVRAPERLRFFTDNARGAEWLRWAKELPGFKSIFDPRAELQSNGLWIQWFVEHFATGDNPELRQKAFAVFFSLGSGFSPGLWGRLATSCRKLLEDGSDAAKDAKSWLPLLVRHVPQGGKRWLATLLEHCDPERDQHAMLLLLDKLFEPQAVQSRYAYSGKEARLEPSLGRHAVDIYCSWRSNVLANLSDQALGSGVAVIIDRHLRTAHRIAASSGDAERAWKSLSRSAIEDHEQNETSQHRGIGVLVDAARDTLEALLEHHPELAEHYLRSWDETQMPLFQRLAIHGWAERRDIAADKKITKLCRSGWVSDNSLLHETMRLAAVALPEASPETIDRLVGHIEAELQNEDEHSERRIYEWLAWTVKHSSTETAADQKLSAIQARNPEWQPSDHPDFLRWSWADTIEPANPGSPEALHRMIEKNPAKAVRHLLGFPKNAQWDGPWWWDALGWLRSTVELHPADGIEIIDLLTGQHAPENPHAGEDLAETIFEVWARSDLGDALSRAVTERLPAIWATGTDQWTRNAVVTGSSVGPLNQAIKHWSGNLAGVVLGLVDREYQAAGEGWTRLAGLTKAVMEAMTGGSDQASRHAQVVLARRLSFLFAIDEQWFRDTILPLVDPNIDLGRAIGCWDGLRFGRLGPPKLLETGLLDLFVAMAQHLGDRRDETGRHYHQRLAEVALFHGINPMEQGWLDLYTASATEESRVEWNRQVSYELAHLSSGAADAQWDAWMRQYWSNRLASQPRALTDEEATALADWTVKLGSRFPQAVELACQHRATVEERSMAVIQMLHLDDQPERVDHVEEHPEDAARLLTHLLANTERALTRPSTLEGGALVEMIPKLLERIPPEQARLLREQAVRKGIDV